MKQLIQNLKSGATELIEVPIPTTKPGFALVHNSASLVSAGTERMLVEFAEKSLLGKARSRPDLVHQVVDKARREGIFSTITAAFNRLEQPMSMGYSSAGTIVALGEGMSGFRIGQRVACAGGGYAVHAEYILVPKNLLTEIPEGVEFEEASFTTLGAIALHGFRQTGVQIGENVVVIGLGLLGMLAVQIAAASGCNVLGVDIDQSKVDLAAQMGIQSVLREGAVELAQSITQDRGYDAVLICADAVSSDPIELAGLLARDRAKVVAVGAVGLNIPRKIYYEKELEFVNSRSYGPGRYDPGYEEAGHDYPIGYVRWTEGRNFEAFLKLVALRKVVLEPIITHRFSIEDALAAYELIGGKRKTPYMGIVIYYPSLESERVRDKVIFREFIEKPNEGGKFVSSHSVKLGVIGAGNFAVNVLLPVLSKIPELELVGIASAAGLNARQAQKKFGFKYSNSDAREVINDNEINTIGVLTRHNLHANQVIEALKAGKHVFCEKPLAMNLPELNSIISVLSNSNPVDDGYSKEKESHPILMVGFNRRFSPYMEEMKKFLAVGKEPFIAQYRVNAGYLPGNHWTQDETQGGGRIIGEACHFIDSLTFLAGALPVSVSALGLADNGRYNEDNVMISLEFSNGSLASLIYVANGDKKLPKERLEVFSGGRVAVLDDFRQLELIYHGSSRILRSRLWQDKGHQAEWRVFTKAIQEEHVPPIPYDQLFSVTRASILAVESLRRKEPMMI